MVDEFPKVVTGPTVDTDMFQLLESGGGSDVVTFQSAAQTGDASLIIPDLKGESDPLLTKTTATQQAGDGTSTYRSRGKINLQFDSKTTIANTTETDAHSFTLPANTLNTNGSAVKVTIWGTTDSTAGDTKTLKLYFGGTAIFTAADVSVSKDWMVSALIVRTSAGNQLIFIEGHFAGAIFTSGTVVSAAKDETTSLIIKSTLKNGVSAVAGELTEQGFLVETIP